MSSQDMKVYNDEKEYIFQNKNRVISFHKENKTLQDIENFSPKSTTQAYQINIVIGLIESKNNNFLICSNKVKEVGEFLSSKIYKIENFIYLPEKINEKKEEDEKYIEMLNDFLQRNPLFYSDSFDLTISFKNLNNQLENKKEKNNSNIFPNTITYFAWNYSLGKIFDYKGMEEFIFPIINGFFDIKNNISEYEKQFSFCIIARKDNRRSGMRFLLRGADSNGNVANFVETEEILLFKDNETYHILSFIQIRGSVPFLWTQDPDCKLNPKVKIKDDFTLNNEIFRLHINELIENYDNVCIINLIDKKGDQKKVGEYYHNLVLNYKEKNPDNEKKLNDTWFDFHHECKKMKYENLSKLMKEKVVENGLKNYSYTHLIFDSKNIILNKKLDEIFHDKNTNLKYEKIQLGIFRNNCMDCLDRTNVSQSVLGRFTLHKMLFELKLLNEEPNGDPFQKFKPNFEKIFKLMWADHGDYISLSYSGTGALKSDFVRTGKRTLIGNLVDGYLSCKRFYINNFNDGYNQDCHDYFLNSINPKKINFKEHKGGNFKIVIPLSFITSFIFYYIICSNVLPKENNTTPIKIVRYIIFSCSVSLTYTALFTVFKKLIIDTHTRYGNK
jgi:hypothetical protein